jgi:hypothetical protein
MQKSKKTPKTLRRMQRRFFVLWTFFYANKKKRRGRTFRSVMVQKAPRSKRSKNFRTRSRKVGFWAFLPKKCKKVIFLENALKT